MSEQWTPEIVLPAPRERPLSVWILTVIDSLFAGVLLIAICIRLSMDPFSGFQRYYQATEYSLLQIVYWGLLGLGICVSATLAWMGSRRARNALLALMTLYLGLGIIQNAVYLVWTANEPLSPGGFAGKQIMEAARSILWLAANYWFLLGRRARAFYA